MTPCPACEHAQLHGWWGLTVPAGKQHCKTCHRTESGRIWHCCACHRSFARDSQADKHRVSGHCVDPHRIRNKNTGRRVLLQRDDGVWASPPPENPLPFWGASVAGAANGDPEEAA